MQYGYAAYGLDIKSTLELPELQVNSSAEADVTIEMGSLGREIPNEDGAITCLQATTQEVYLSWGRSATLLISNGRKIIIDPYPGVDERVLRLFVLGAGLGVLLHQRRLLVLHASAVAVDGQVVAFIGDKGWGKSTTAAALHALGHQLMTDDLVAIYIDNHDRPMVLPGYPQVKLWPEAIAALGTDPNNLPQVREEIEKRAQTVLVGFSTTPLPLSAIYVLGGGEALSVDAIPPQISIMLLIRHLYVSRFGTTFAQSADGKDYFLKCGELAKRVPIRGLKRPRDLSALGQLAEMIENDVRQLMQEPSSQNP